MIQPLNIPALVPPTGSSSLAPAARGGQAGSPAAWFEPAAGVDMVIRGDLDPAARGLSVEQHAARVLQHLCGERGEGA